MKPQSVKIGFVTHILWEDSASEYGWTRETNGGSIRVMSAGIAVGADDVSVTITTSVTLNGSANSPISIPWCAILKFKQTTKFIDGDEAGWTLLNQSKSSLKKK